VKPTRARLQELDAAVDRYRALLGASTFTIEGGAAPHSMAVTMSRPVASR
jgi:hypothetical protein